MTNPHLIPTAFKLLKTGDNVRVVDKAGRVAEGVWAEPNRSSDRLAVVAGLTWAANEGQFFLLSEPVPEARPAPLTLSETQMRDAVATISGGQSMWAATIADIIRATLGYDPSFGRPEKTFGGKSKGAWTREHWAVAQNLRTLAKLEADGVLKKVVTGTDDARVTLFSTRRGSGWVLQTNLDQALEARRAVTDKALHAKLLAQASATVAARYSAEVQTELRRLLSAV